MANIRSSAKRARQAVPRTERNRSVRTACKTRIKNVRKAVDGKDAEKAKDCYRQMASELDRAVKKGVMHRNAANRRKSRLLKAVSAL